ncbi:MAG: hypothetical protein H2040_02240 [Euryhalocaulis sp.]|uniref:sensor histidine kinase n=1 Tax=Euryhalocaulis sp. TaxID=2744307 RepID=UPI00185779E3|nr:ATP-binding protein [Euryhalocaulis sp.]MBA4800660.1 hypothetical protein [Euryhalocaulis sp.]
MERTVESLIVDAPALPPETTGDAAYEIFSSDENLFVCAVVDQGRPVGLLNRDRFYQQMADRFGRALYSQRPVTFLMQDDPLIVPHDTPVARLNTHILESRPAALLDGFIIADGDGRFLGAGTTFALFSAAVEETESRSAMLERMTVDLETARQEALEHARVKGEFLATMSHEIRTPLNGVLGLSNVLIRAGLNPDQEKLARTIHESGETLLSLLNDILDMSKMDAGQAELNREHFEIESLAEHTRTFWDARAREAGLSYAVECKCEISRIDADQGRIRQIISNLVGNALKFTPEGGVTVRILSEDSSAPGCGRLRVEVADTGIGVPAAARERIFEAFSQAESSHTRRFGGTGLGLTICKRLVDMMGGEIGFRNRDSGGSTFWFDLPVETPAGDQRHEAA